MLKEELDIDAFFGESSQDIVGLCEAHIDAESLADSLDRRSPFTRKELCELLGIGESTLSGWLKDGRLPQMAKITLLLLANNRQLWQEIRNLKADAGDLKVIQNGPRYQVCEITVDEEGEPVGRVVADGIATLDDARLLASSRRAARLLNDAEALFNYVADNTENKQFSSEARSLQKKYEAHLLFLRDHPRWREQFGKASSLNRFFGELGLAASETEGDNRQSSAGGGTV